MDEQWEVVYRCTAAYKAEILRAILEDHEIPAVIVDKKDSSYLIGEIEVYVHQANVLIATQLINGFENNE
jgi:hypothetical protein